jgi:hypothetical protein
MELRQHARRRRRRGGALAGEGDAAAHSSGEELRRRARWRSFGGALAWQEMASLELKIEMSIRKYYYLCGHR